MWQAVEEGMAGRRDEIGKAMVELAGATRFGSEGMEKLGDGLRRRRLGFARVTIQPGDGRIQLARGEFDGGRAILSGRREAGRSIG